ncbi:malto-oligosyltrehalose synthase [Arachnia rubra]|uniref:Malto-oligosyltrehalose synthase n=1 Tax=Arachnia rubra TaxID=1547448 RepID=A0ABX7Y5K6_9ACTN|nr:malto-oligosyltrehalose synthase [Arachnia rubra]MDO4646935.1 malto-oligosyltrehalose synthase [Propionibacteriaceae bacterium]QUC08341.1 malto-oligosyltrehalose synthase [Arachnia rubra]BCR79712.1 malto-oligosyltrehalose synthase [Arachnia rubra]
METNRTVPNSTYRMQLHGGFTFDDAAAWLPYLHALGITHLFCSPILQAAPESTHGYDVVDHSRISEECGGEDGFRRLSQAAHELGMGVVVDVVPNHMAVPTPLWHNRALWDVLRRGAESEYSDWFDLDMTDSQAILMPVLGHRIGRELENINLTTAVINGEEQPVVTYYDHVFPVRPGTEELPLEELLERQWYRLAYWRIGSEELNYRRFFDVDTLAAIRVEDPAIFEATHRKLLQLFHDGLIDGFRIDHIDGLANPRQYLADLQRATGGCWVVAEKILEYDEELPADFECAGTTGYDSLLRVAGLFHVPGSVPRLTDLWERLSGSGEGFASTVLNAKRTVVKESLFTELNRLVNIAMAICEDDIRLRDYTRRQLSHAISGLLYQFSRYRAYVEPGRVNPESEREIITEAAARAREYLTADELDALDFVVALALGETGEQDMGGADTLPAPSQILNQLPGRAHEFLDLRSEFMVRFAQTCGPVMAKSKEDTAFYRWNRFIGVNEVGSDPNIIGINQDDFHGFSRALAADWPTAMTTLSTHDTKRSEDVRARLAVLTEYPREWEQCVNELRTATAESRPVLLDGGTELFLWQTLAATWTLPGTAAGAEVISADRLTKYLTKAIREAKLHTSWTTPDEAYEEAVLEFATACLANPEVAAALDAFTELTFQSVRANVLGQKLIQLTMPGVPDLYQGCEVVDLSLVDPDNRRPIDYYRRAGVLGSLMMNPPADLDAEKLLVTSRALLLRRDHPEAFRGPDADYRPVSLNTGHAVVFERGYKDSETPVAIAVATRVQSGLDETGWGDAELVLPNLRFLDVLSGQEYPGGATPLADILATLPVALLVHQVDVD